MCQRKAAKHLRARLVTSVCSGINHAAQGTTPSAAGRNKSLQENFMVNGVIKNQVVMSWDGNGQGTIRCAVCTKMWPYAFKTWRKQILIPCAGSSLVEDQRRKDLVTLLRKSGSSHSPDLDVNTDYM